MSDVGWFRDPIDPSLARWHDGTEWTDHTLVIADQPPGAGTPPPPDLTAPPPPPVDERPPPPAAEPEPDPRPEPPAPRERPKLRYRMDDEP